MADRPPLTPERLARLRTWAERHHPDGLHGYAAHLFDGSCPWCAHSEPGTDATPDGNAHDIAVDLIDEATRLRQSNIDLAIAAGMDPQGGCEFDSTRHHISDPTSRTGATPVTTTPVFYEFVGNGARLRDDHDGHPLVLTGTNDNGAGDTLCLDQAGIDRLVDAGILRRQPPDTDALTDALERHIGPLTDDVVAALEQLSQVSPSTAADVYLALTTDS
jgi:hypothetical protein